MRSRAAESALQTLWTEGQVSGTAIPGQPWWHVLNVPPQRDQHSAPRSPRDPVLPLAGYPQLSACPSKAEEKHQPLGGGPPGHRVAQGIKDVLQGREAQKPCLVWSQGLVTDGYLT